MSNTRNTEEKEALFDKIYECPICASEIKAKTVKTGKAKLESTDDDLRPVYQNIDALKYDVVFCKSCGYGSLKKFFEEPVTPVQQKNIQERVVQNFKGTLVEPEVYSYEDSIMRHKFALLSSVVKLAPVSQQAYTALKIAWLYRGQGQQLDREVAGYKEQLESIKGMELEFIEKACQGFMTSYTTEEFPICGMDEATFCYLVSNLCFKTKRYDDAKRWISMVVSSREASSRVKEKARDLKDEIMKVIGEE